MMTFDDVQNSLSGKSKKYIVNSFKANKMGLQKKIEEQGNSFLEKVK